jgi:hypothetical protein
MADKSNTTDVRLIENYARSPKKGSPEALLFKAIGLGFRLDYKGGRIQVQRYDDKKERLPQDLREAIASQKERIGRILSPVSTERASEMFSSIFRGAAQAGKISHDSPEFDSFSRMTEKAENRWQVGDVGGFRFGLYHAARIGLGINASPGKSPDKGLTPEPEQATLEGEQDLGQREG